jgi:23S rRNA pseudouridine2605 synthase
MMNKPPGVLTSVGDSRGRPTVTDDLVVDRRLFPVGRLDLDSRGLLLLTDDGELAMRLMHPRYGVEKEYLVRITGQPSADALREIATGMVVRGERFQPATARILAASPAETQLTMVLREGRKREVRRLWQAVGHDVLDLQRVRVDGLQLGDLEEGAVRPLTDDEVARLKVAVS